MDESQKKSRKTWHAGRIRKKATTNEVFYAFNYLNFNSIIIIYIFFANRNFIRTDEEHDSDESMEITKTGGDFVRKSK